MSAPIRRSEYQPLTKPRFIRLLTLLPSPTSTRPIECRLHQASLDDLKDLDPKYTYEALSYVWGDKNGSVPITCDGRELLVTPNCASALRHLRHKLTRRVLWIDAICIDQQSVEERNCQVPLMGEIYTTARRVIIWLGPSEAKDEALLRLARFGGRLYQVRGMPADKILPHQRTRKWLSKVITEDEIEAVQRVCSNVWFTRIWTIQELVLATSASFQVGHTECPASDLYNFLLVAETFASSTPPELHRFRMRNRAMEIMNPEGKHSTKSFIAYSRSLNRSAEGDPLELLAMLCQLSALSDASDSRDKVYGMCGLLQTIFTRNAALPRVNYNNSIAEVLEDATRCLITASKSLWPLEIISRSNGDDMLPSWVLDLRDPANIHMGWQPILWRNISNDALFRYPVKSRQRIRLEDRVKSRNRAPFPKRAPEMAVPLRGGPGQLEVRAKYLAEVEQVYARMPFAPTESRDADQIRMACLSEWVAVATDLDENLPPEQTTADGYISAVEHLTPELNCLRGDDEKSSATLDASQKKVSRKKSEGPCDIYDGAVLFRTSCGLLGLCKGDVRPHSTVWQMDRGRYPFVLQLEPLGNESSQDELHRLVGIADICGLDAEERVFRWAENSSPEDFQDIVLV